MKKVLILGMLAMATVLFTTSCQTDAPAPEVAAPGAPAAVQPGAEAAPVEAPDDGPFSYPMPGNRTVTWWEPMQGHIAPNFTSHGDTPFVAALQEMTGITIEFMHPPEGQAAEALTLMIAAGDLPDIIFQNWLTAFPGGPERAIEDGVILPLNDVFERYAPNVHNLLEVERPDWGRLARTDSGFYYVFPFLRETEMLQVFRGPFMRADWLEELGLGVPETIDDWENAMIAFRDEMGAQTPFTPLPGLRYNCPVAAAFGIRLGMGRNEAGNVSFGWVEPAMLDYLTLMNRWYQMGLLDPDIATITPDIFNARFTSGMTGVGHANLGAGLGVLLNAMADDPVFDLVALPVPVLQRGQSPMLGQYEFAFIGLGAAITTGVNDLEAAARLLDFGYTMDGYLLHNFGLEGRDWNWDGDFPRFTDAVLSHPQGWPVSQAIAAVARSSFFGPFVQAEDYIVQIQVWPQQVNALSTWMQSATGHRILPPLTPSPDDAARMAMLMEDINSFVLERYFAFVMGHEEINQANFDAFVSNVFALGLQDVLDIQQAALDRFHNR